MNNTCHFCGNKHFKKTSVQYLYKHDDQFLIVNSVPCVQCEYCGEQYFEANVLKKIEEKFQDIHVHGKQAKKRVQVPIEQFTDFQAR